VGPRRDRRGHQHGSTDGAGHQDPSTVVSEAEPEPTVSTHRGATILVAPRSSGADPMARAIPTRNATRRARGALLAVTALVALLLAGPFAGAAGAHASVIEVRPGPAEVLTESPPKVEVWFTSGVDVRLGGLTVYDANGDRIPTGTLRQPTPDHLVVPITEDLDDGSYIVTYRTVSEADAHTMSGTWTFQVGDAATATADVDAVAAGLLAGQRADRAVAVGWGVARWAVYASLALLVGGVVFGAAIWPRARDARATRRIIAAGWIGLFASTLLGLLLYGAYSRGGALVDAIDPDVVRDTVDTRLGTVWVVRLLLLVLALPLLRVLFAHRPAPTARLPRWWTSAAVALGAVLVCTPALAGHASTGDWQLLARAADGLHVAAMAIWLGGLVVLAAVVLRADDVDGIRGASRRFSRVAIACVGVLVVTGAFQTWRLVGGLSALRDDEYGRILVVKLVAFAVLLVVASFSREITQRVLPAVPAVRGGALDLADRDLPDAPDATDARDGTDPGRERTRLRRSVWGEVAIGALVLALSAMLVNSAPPADAEASDPATSVTIEQKDVTLVVTATPGAAGFNDVRVNTYSPDGAPLDAATVEMTIALPARDVAPMAVPLRELGPGNFFPPGIDIPLAGRWDVRATIRLGPVDRVDVTGTLVIR